MSKPANHTPGPWSIVPAHQAVNSWIVGAVDGDSVADCSPGSPFTTSDQATANAKLIAAAPDMLEALQRIERIIDVNLWHQHEKIEDAKQIAREAIAKATGGAE